MTGTDVLPIDELLDSVVREGRYVSERGDAADYNYMQAANRLMREAERLYGERCIGALIERIGDESVDGPAIRVMIASLIRLVPTRQTVYERILTEALPSWHTMLGGNPQDELPSQFIAASEQAKKQRIEYPQDLIPALLKATDSSSPDVAIATLKALERIGDLGTIESARRLIDSDVTPVRNAAILTTARLSSMDTATNRLVANLVLHKERPISERVAAFEAIMVNGGAKEDVDLLRDGLAAGQIEAELLNCILDSGRRDLLPVLEQQLEHHEIADLPEATLRRISRKQILPDQLREGAMQVLGGIVRSYINAAAELVSVKGKKRPAPSRAGLIAHRNSSITAAWVGHTGLFITEDSVMHCTTGNDPNAVHSISFAQWKGSLECWGIRADYSAVNLWAAINRAREIDSWRTEYDGAHNNQKGSWFKGWFCAPSYWEADCVGFTEHCYEYAGGNPTPSTYETGLGWPLTVREQRDHMRFVFPC